MEENGGRDFQSNNHLVVLCTLLPLAPLGWSLKYGICIARGKYECTPGRLTPSAPFTRACSESIRSIAFLTNHGMSLLSFVCRQLCLGRFRACRCAMSAVTGCTTCIFERFLNVPLTFLMQWLISAVDKEWHRLAAWHSRSHHPWPVQSTLSHTPSMYRRDGAPRLPSRSKAGPQQRGKRWQA